MATIPATRYVKSDDVHIAYQVVGEGSLDLMFVPGFVSHIEAVWQSPAASAVLRRLASFCRLIRPGRNRSVLLAPVSTIAGFFSTIQSFDRCRSATRRAISADASSGIGNTELTLISPST